MRTKLGSEARTYPAYAALGVLYIFTLAAVVGFATFGLNPSLLAGYPDLVSFYGRSFSFFAQAQIWIAWITLVALLAALAGWRWVGAFVALYGLSLGSELLGTTAGIPFGEYYYTDALGWKWFGHVPLLIPLSWFFMAIPSYAIAGWGPNSGRRGRVGRVLLASLVLLAWDLALDPAMSRATAYWVWENPGVYYGMPLLNLIGWYVTGLALMGALALLGSAEWIDRLPRWWVAAFYGANLLLPVGMSAASGLWGAVGVTIAALGIVLVAERIRGGREAGAPATPVEVTA